MRRVYIPEMPGAAGSHMGIREAVAAVSPFPLIDGMPSPGEPLIVVVCNASMLLAAGSLASGHDIVVWAWHCPEVLAQRAEGSHPVVYGHISLASVDEAAAKGAMRRPDTDMLARLESTFGFPEVIPA